MKKIGIYPGSFNPWHKGHRDVLNKALQVFDRVDIVLMQNPEKDEVGLSTRLAWITSKTHHIPNVKIYWDDISLLNFVNDSIRKEPEAKFSIIRGLRNGNDLQYEMNNQYWNEDVGVKVPFVYFITDRSLAHVSSSAIRSVNKLGLKHEY